MFWNHFLINILTLNLRIENPMLTETYIKEMYLRAYTIDLM